MKAVVVLSGAGISAESGLKTFRGRTSSCAWARRCRSIRRARACRNSWQACSARGIRFVDTSRLIISVAPHTNASSLRPVRGSSKTQVSRSL